MVTLILYSRPGCHLCEDLEEKLRAIAATTTDLPPFSLEIRDITEREEWMMAYQFEVPVLTLPTPNGNDEQPLPRPAPRAAAVQIEQMLRQVLGRN